MKTTHFGWREFRDDLGASLRAWTVAPQLPFTSVAIFLVFMVPDSWFWFFLPVVLFAVGWVGTERIWYLRIFRDQSIVPSELWRLTWAFFWRYALLGLVAVIVWSPAFGLALFRASEGSAGADEAWERTDVIVVVTIVTLVLDVTLTFVTPALAFTTRRVREALGAGVSMLRDQWPRSCWYALVPPLTLVVLVRSVQSRSLNLTSEILISAASALLLLWFKGATVRFYLRRVDVGDQGSAFEGRKEPAPDG